jgi:hypothetical protein
MPPGKADMETERANLAAWAWSAGMVICLLLVLIGWLVSPVDSLSGRPILLLPDVKAVGDYRRQASGWVGDLRLLDGDLAQLLAGNTDDLFEQSRRSQAALDRAARLAQAVDIHAPPPPLISLQQQLSQTTFAYLESARAASSWVSVPDEAHYQQAAQVLEQAQEWLRELESSQWLKTPH